MKISSLYTIYEKTVKAYLSANVYDIYLSVYDAWKHHISETFHHEKGQDSILRIHFLIPKNFIVVDLI